VVEAQNITEAALILGRSAPYFPAGTIHVVVVDPGVGTVRRPIAARLGTQYFVGPDNGIVTLLLERAEQLNWPVEVVHLDRPEFWLADVSYVFHGRDIFSPVAAHLATGRRLQELGTPVSDPLRLTIPRPERTQAGVRGQIIHIDHFGNAASNIRVEHMADLLQGRGQASDTDSPLGINHAVISSASQNQLRNLISQVTDEKDRFTVEIAGMTIRGLVTTFGERPPGEVVALFGSTGNLIVSVVNGNFAGPRHIQPGQTIELRIER
jgi:S-adenosylmethionine hydrolase